MKEMKDKRFEAAFENDRRNIDRQESQPKGDQPEDWR
jgi:hypothetical protein